MRCFSARSLALRIPGSLRAAKPVAATSQQCRAAANGLSLQSRLAPPRAAATPMARRGASRARAVETRTLAAAAAPVQSGREIRVRFAPSPTGNLHVGGARTALFNWLYARQLGGKFILRVEDTDTERSTRASEDAMVADLKWLGLDWDEGPDIGGPHAPYRQSERASIYVGLAQKLVSEGKAYPCFCTEAELEAMKAAATAAGLPPKYTGKWARASKEEVDAMLATGAQPVYRFRVPAGKIVSIQDKVRGEVSWSTDAVGDFVLVRSNGLPVYNFCVAVDDSQMGITHVLRAEEHLPNTLRQVLVYEALSYPSPEFAHVSLILAPDRSKLSKRHGATSVGEFREQGYSPEAMVNYLSLLGWNDGSEKEIYSVQELVQAFSIERITKSPAVFDKVKLNWVNGQHLKALPPAEGDVLIAAYLQRKGLIGAATGPFAERVCELVRPMCELVSDAGSELSLILAYPLAETLLDAKAEPVLKDDFAGVVAAVLAAAEAGELQAAVAGGHDTWGAWCKALGKKLGRKGKGLFMPLRIALTGKVVGPDVGEQLAVLAMAPGQVGAAEVVGLDQRLQKLKEWAAAAPTPATAAV